MISIVLQVLIIPLWYNQGVSGELYWTGAGLHGFNVFPNFFPNSAGINVLEREQSYQAQVVMVNQL